MTILRQVTRINYLVMPQKIFLFFIFKVMSQLGKM